MLPAKPFYMIRHGETEANLAQIVAGSGIDSPLTDLGREQAQKARDIIANLEVKPVKVFHSDLSRARDTAYIINEIINTPIYEEAELTEMDCGDWEGLPYEECPQLFGTVETPPNGESFKEFSDRIRTVLLRILNSCDAPVLNVCHGGVFRAFGGIYNLDVPSIFKNCHLYEFQPCPEKTSFPWDVYSYNYDEEPEKVVRTKESIYDDALMESAS